MDNETILEEANERYPIGVQGWKDIYKEAEEDMEFIYDVGDGQWPAGERAKRESADRPVLTINKLQKFIRQLRGDAIQNKIQMKVVPVDSVSDPETAKFYADLIRQIEYVSDADSAYDTAFMHATSSSVGFIRLLTQYVDDESFDQEAIIERIINPNSIHFDPKAKKFQYEDAKWCFAEDLMLQSDFKHEFPQAELTDFSGTGKALFGEWLDGDKIRVAEYFYKEPVIKEIVQLETGDIITLSDTMSPEYIKSQGGIIVNNRKVHTHKVMWAKLNGAEVLDSGEWIGKDIPIIPMFGDEIVVKGRKYYLSLLRGAKGSAQMYNYWATAATEAVALAPKMPYIVDYRQIKGFETEWEEANKENRMYIRYNAIQGMDKPRRETQSDVPRAIMSMMSTTAYDIEDHLGRYQASKGEASNERSGKAITARIQQSDKGSFFCIDNRRKSIVCVCKQLIDIIPKIYDTQRALRVRGEDGKERVEEVNVPELQPDDSVQVRNDLTVGKYDLIATTGASFSSARQEMVATMLEAMQYAPTVAPFIAPLIFKFSDAEGAEEIYSEIKKGMEKMASSGTDTPKGATRMQ